MKYGDQLEQASVLEWSLHNVDYNAIKHEIKVHTTRDQATAIAIPGYQDPALQKFENRLSLELHAQHDRVDLFVNSKADEISRRIESLHGQIKRQIAKCQRDNAARVNLKRQRKFSKYERDLLRCEEDILALSRFIHAQAEAFRKITKKYKKWTGSPNLGARFRDITTDPKSFTRRDFNHLQARFEEVLATLRASTSHLSEPSSPSSAEPPSLLLPRSRGSRHEEQPAPRFTPSQSHYWNEYDYGSDGDGGQDNGYAIYIDPEADDSFPGLKSMQTILRRPLKLAKTWFSRRQGDAAADPARRSLLHPQDTEAGYGSVGAATAPNFGGNFGDSSPFGTETDEDGGYASSDDNMPLSGYADYYAALPSVNEQRVERYREQVLSWSTLGAFTASFVLLVVASVLIITGRHKLRAEVDAGVTFGVVASLFCACLGLGMMLYRTDRLGMLYRAAVWTSFLASCMLNGMLLVLVVGNTGRGYTI